MNASVVRWFALAAAAAGLGIVALTLSNLGPEHSGAAGVRRGSGEARIGGPFTLASHRGETVTEKTFLGKPTVYFFGYTHCPDVCPTTLYNLTQQLEALGPHADRLNVVFVTIDPTRDTPEQLARYLESFDPRILGLTGSAQEVTAMAKSFGVHFGPMPDQGHEMMSHTSSAILMDANGRFITLLRHDDAAPEVTAKLRRALQG